MHLMFLRSPPLLPFPLTVAAEPDDGQGPHSLALQSKTTWVVLSVVSLMCVCLLTLAALFYCFAWGCTDRKRNEEIAVIQ